MRDNREQWLDIAKGLGIIAVVIGHSNAELISKYLYWFHMPLFFFLSGYLYKHPQHSVLKWSIKRTKQLLLPYLFFYIFITMSKYLSSTVFSVSLLVKDINNFLYGGQLLTYFYGPFWFVTCLLITQIIFALLVSRVKNKKVLIGIIIFMFTSAHIESHLMGMNKNFSLPWSIDVVLFSIFFYALGYFWKTRLFQLSNKIGIGSLLLCSIFITLDIKGILNYKLDLKPLLYNNLILDIAIPVTFIILIIFICMLASKLFISRSLSYIGAASLTIMYLHIPVNLIFMDIFDTPEMSAYLFTILGIAIPLILHSLFQQFDVTRKLFLGSLNRSKINRNIEVNV